MGQKGLVCDWQTGLCTAGAQLGQTCAFSDPANPVPGTESVRCGEDLSCDPVGLTCVGGYCSPGASCNDIFTDTDCPEGYLCIGNFATPPTCQQLGDAGSPCGFNDECNSTSCGATGSRNHCAVSETGPSRVPFFVGLKLVLVRRHGPSPGSSPARGERA